METKNASATTNKMTKIEDSSLNEAGPAAGRQEERIPGITPATTPHLAAGELQNPQNQKQNLQTSPMLFYSDAGLAKTAVVDCVQADDFLAQPTQSGSRPASSLIQVASGNQQEVVQPAAAARNDKQGVACLPSATVCSTSLSTSKPPTTVDEKHGRQERELAIREGEGRESVKEFVQRGEEQLISGQLDAEQLREERLLKHQRETESKSSTTSSSRQKRDLPEDEKIPFDEFEDPVLPLDDDESGEQTMIPDDFCSMTQFDAWLEQFATHGVEDQMHAVRQLEQASVRERWKRILDRYKEWTKDCKEHGMYQPCTLLFRSSTTNSSGTTTSNSTSTSTGGLQDDTEKFARLTALAVREDERGMGTKYMRVLSGLVPHLVLRKPRSRSSSTSEVDTTQSSTTFSSATPTSLAPHDVLPRIRFWDEKEEPNAKKRVRPQGAVESKTPGNNSPRYLVLPWRYYDEMEGVSQNLVWRRSKNAAEILIECWPNVFYAELIELLVGELQSITIADLQYGGVLTVSGLMGVLQFILRGTAEEGFCYLEFYRKAYGAAILQSITLELLGKTGVLDVVLVLLFGRIRSLVMVNGGKITREPKRLRPTFVRVHEEIAKYTSHEFDYDSRGEEFAAFVKDHFYTWLKPLLRVAGSETTRTRTSSTTAEGADRTASTSSIFEETTTTSWSHEPVLRLVERVLESANNLYYFCSEMTAKKRAVQILADFDQHTNVLEFLLNCLTSACNVVGAEQDQEINSTLDPGAPTRCILMLLPLLLQQENAEVNKPAHRVIAFVCKTLVDFFNNQEQPAEITAGPGSSSSGSSGTPFEKPPTTLLDKNFYLLLPQQKIFLTCLFELLGKTLQVLTTTPHGKLTYTVEELQQHLRLLRKEDLLLSTLGPQLWAVFYRWYSERKTPDTAWRAIQRMFGEFAKVADWQSLIAVFPPIEAQLLEFVMQEFLNEENLKQFDLAVCKSLMKRVNAIDRKQSLAEHRAEGQVVADFSKILYDFGQFLNHFILRKEAAGAASRETHDGEMKSEVDLVLGRNLALFAVQRFAEQHLAYRLDEDAGVALAYPRASSEGAEGGDKISKSETTSPAASSFVRPEVLANFQNVLGLKLVKKGLERLEFLEKPGIARRGKCEKVNEEKYCERTGTIKPPYHPKDVGFVMKYVRQSSNIWCRCSIRTSTVTTTQSKNLQTTSNSGSTQTEQETNHPTITSSTSATDAATTADAVNTTSTTAREAAGPATSTSASDTDAGSTSTATARHERAMNTL
ncbi:unnamed protein product [Amoebophrya sp. A120]|nr:unnamed protein product [Amoebophrya sp. A120]|eukprot:GSA120T00022352001.1